MKQEPNLVEYNREVNEEMVLTYFLNVSLFEK